MTITGVKDKPVSIIIEIDDVFTKISINNKVNNVMSSIVAMVLIA